MFKRGRQTNIVDTEFITIWSEDWSSVRLTSHVCLFRCLSWQIHCPTLYSFFACSKAQRCIFIFSDLQNLMKHIEVGQSRQDKMPSPPPSFSYPSPSSSILKQHTISVPVTPILSNHPMMLLPDSVSQANAYLIPGSITKVPSNTSLGRVITTSKMAALQSHWGSGSSLANLRSSLMSEDNPRRGSALVWWVHA